MTDGLSDIFSANCTYLPPSFRLVWFGFWLVFVVFASSFCCCCCCCFFVLFFVPCLCHYFYIHTKFSSRKNKLKKDLQGWWQRYPPWCFPRFPRACLPSCTATACRWKTPASCTGLAARWSQPATQRAYVGHTKYYIVFGWKRRRRRTLKRNTR